jgi:hypothetical protein
MLFDFPITSSIRVKDGTRERRLKTLSDARSFVDDAFAARRNPVWRELHQRPKNVKSEDDAIEAIGALREVLVLEGLLMSSDRDHV